jgi:RHS repeat-associated protein
MFGSSHGANYTCYGYSAGQNPLLSVLAFNGHWRDPSTGCYHLGNGYRTYNAKLMRFHSPDSLSPFARGGINAYAFCGLDPINNVDPSGHMFKRFRARREPQYGLARIKNTDTHELTQAYSGWYLHPDANGWDAEMAIKLPARAEKKIYYAAQLTLAKKSQSKTPEWHVKTKLKSVSAKIDESRNRLGQLKRELPQHAREVAESMVGRPPAPPPYSQINEHAVVLPDLDVAAANHLIRSRLTEHDAPPVYSKR